MSDSHPVRWLSKAERWSDFKASYGYDAPRAWQAAALEVLIEALEQRAAGEEKKERSPGVILRAVMGAGKSLLIAELARCRALEPGEVILITTSRRHLVEQLNADLGARLGHQRVGVFYQEKKQPEREILITTVSSMPRVIQCLETQKKTVALWIIDEAHRSECRTILSTFSALRPEDIVGMTATPFRSEIKESLSIFGRMVYDYGLSQAIQDGVLVAPHIVPWAGDPEETIDQALIEMIRTHTEGPGVVSAPTCDDADAYAEMLTEAGIAAKSVHSKMPHKEVTRRVQALEAGELRCVVHVNLLTEGVNYPWLRWIGLRQVRGGDVPFWQEVGRVLRSHPGKERAVILDPGGAFANRNANRGADLARVREAVIFLRVVDEVTVEQQRRGCQRWLRQKRWGCIAEIFDQGAALEDSEEVIQVLDHLQGTVKDVVTYHHSVFSDKARRRLREAGAEFHYMHHDSTPICVYVPLLSDVDQRAQRALCEDWIGSSIRLFERMGVYLSSVPQERATSVCEGLFTIIMRLRAHESMFRPIILVPKISDLTQGVRASFEGVADLREVFREKEVVQALVSGLNATEAQIFRLSVRFEKSGFLERWKGNSDINWRDQAPSLKQLELLRTLCKGPNFRRASGTIPDAEREPLRAALRVCNTLSRGCVSDLLGVLFSINKQGQWPAELLPP